MISESKSDFRDAKRALLSLSLFLVSFSCLEARTSRRALFVLLSHLSLCPARHTGIFPLCLCALLIRCHDHFSAFPFT